MKFTKAYVLAINELEEYVFLNESDRNEMALAVFQEDTMNRFNFTINWYGSYYADMVEVLGAELTHKNILARCRKETMEDMFTYETKIVEG